MDISRALAATAALLSLSLSACATGPASRLDAAAAISDPARPGTSAGAEARSRHVVVISVDGLRPDAIQRSGARTMQRLVREGSFSGAARTVLPSITLPSHTSMLTGVEPEVHGITWNHNATASRGTVRVPTVFGIARAHGLTTAAFFSKGKFQHLMVPSALDHAVAPAGNGKWFADRTAEEVEQYLLRARPNLMFVHFGEPDYAGHLFGWMRLPYRLAVRRADGGIQRVLSAADRAFGRGNYTVLLTADHGGHRHSHGSAAVTDVTIPWLAWGKGVRPDTRLQERIHTTDTAATALWLLGLQLPELARGTPVTAAFLPSARAALAPAAPAAAGSRPH